MHWITRNFNVAYNIGARAARAYQAGEISLEQLRDSRAEMAANPPTFPDPYSESGWTDAAAWTDRLIAEAA
jgi:hypothetical protein